MVMRFDEWASARDGCVRKLPQHDLPFNRSQDVFSIGSEGDAPVTILINADAKFVLKFHPPRTRNEETVECAPEGVYSGIVQVEVQRGSRRNCFSILLRGEAVHEGQREKKSSSLEHTLDIRLPVLAAETQTTPIKTKKMCSSETQTTPIDNKNSPQVEGLSLVPFPTTQAFDCKSSTRKVQEEKLRNMCAELVFFSHQKLNSRIGGEIRKNITLSRTQQDNVIKTMDNGDEKRLRRREKNKRYRQRKKERDHQEEQEKKLLETSSPQREIVVICSSAQPSATDFKVNDQIHVGNSEKEPVESAEEYTEIVESSKIVSGSEAQDTSMDVRGLQEYLHNQPKHQWLHAWAQHQTVEQPQVSSNEKCNKIGNQNCDQACSKSKSRDSDDEQSAVETTKKATNFLYDFSSYYKNGSTGRAYNKRKR